MAGETRRKADAVLASPNTLAWLAREWAAGRWTALQAAPLQEFYGIPDGVIVPARRVEWGWQLITRTALYDYAVRKAAP